MRKHMKKWFNRQMMSHLSAFVMAVGVYAANTRCCWLLHQPKMPDEMKKLKRF